MLDEDLTNVIRSEKDALEYIINLGIDCNGYATADGLKELLFEFVDVAKLGIEKSKEKRSYLFILNDNYIVEDKQNSDFMDAIMWCFDHIGRDGRERHEFERIKSVLQKSLRGFDEDDYSGMVDCANTFMNESHIDKVYLSDEQLYSGV